MKLQISLEFVIVFTFVIIVFMLMFVMVASQRILLLNQQTFSQLQLISQNIAQQIDIAEAAGNGYSANIPLFGNVALSISNITITKNGIIIINGKVGRQIVEAVAYSNAKNILTPSALSTNYISIQNSFGQICIDIKCPNAAAQPSRMTLNSQVVHVASFDGRSSYVTINNLVYNFNMSVNPGAIGTGKLSVNINGGAWLQSGASLMPGRWAFVGFVNNVSANRLSIYINGQLQGSSSAEGLTTESAFAWIDPYNISGIGPVMGPGRGSTASFILGCKNPAACIGYFNGSMANVQVYGLAALNPSQVMRLYQEGVAGQPVISNITSWFTLNGNPNDSVAANDIGIVSGSLLFPTTAELFASVTNSSGNPSSNVLVGFSATSNNFTNSQTFTNFTNANGMATAFLNQISGSGSALVKAVAYNGNTALQSNLAGWWPLNIGTGKTASDISGNGNTANIVNASWNRPAYLADFNGKNSYLSITDSKINTGVGYNTVSFWMYWNGAQNEMPFGFRGYDLFFNGTCLGFNTGAGDLYGVSSNALANEWLYIAAVFNNGPYSGNNKLYINGISVPLSQCAGSAGSGTATQNFHISGWPTNSNSIFNGSIANLQVYGTALSQSQVMQLYQKGLSSPPLLVPSFAGWWPFDGDVNDYSNNQNNGTIYGNVAFTGGPAQTSNQNRTSILAPDFLAGNTGSTFITLGPPNSVLQFPVNTVGLTISIWFNLTVGQASEGPLLTTQGGGCGYNISFPSSSSVRASDACGDYYDAPYTFQTGTMYNLIATVNPSTGMESYYLNGVPLAHGKTPVWMSNNQWSSIEVGRAFNGLISNIQIYNTSLTPGQAPQLYQKGVYGVPVSSQNLVGWWPLNGDANDFSPYGTNGGSSHLDTAYAVYTFAGPSVTYAYSAASYPDSSPPTESVAITSGYNWYLCSAAYNNQLVSTSWVQDQNGGEESVGHQSASNTCTATQSPGTNPMTIGGFGVSDGAIAPTLLTQGTEAGTGFSIPYNISASGTYAFIVVTSLETLSASNLGPGCATADYATVPSSTGANPSVLLIACQSQAAGSYSPKISLGNLNFLPLSASPPLLINSLNDYGLNFNGQSGNFLARSSEVSTTTNKYNTVSFWMYWNGGLNEIPFGFNNYGLEFNAQSGCFGFTTSGSDLYGTDSGQLAKRWVYVTAGFFNGAYANSYLYINGVNQTLSQCAGSAGSGTATTSMQLSGAPINMNYLFNGSIANFEVFNTLLTANQIYQLYQNQMPPSGSVAVPLSVIP